MKGEEQTVLLLVYDRFMVTSPSTYYIASQLHAVLYTAQRIVPSLNNCEFHTSMYIRAEVDLCEIYGIDVEYPELRLVRGGPTA